MTKDEFECKCSNYLQKQIILSDDEWKTILYVYNYHPAITHSKGKLQITHLYCDMGFEFIKHMVDTAENLDQIDKEICDLRLQINQLEQDRNIILGAWGIK